MSVISHLILALVLIVVTRYMHVEASGRQQDILLDELLVWLSADFFNDIGKKQIAEIGISLPCSGLKADRSVEYYLIKILLFGGMVQSELCHHIAR